VAPSLGCKSRPVPGRNDVPVPVLPRLRHPIPVDARIYSVLFLQGQCPHGMISAVELVIYLPIFVAGFGCGIYVRYRILEKRRSQYHIEPNIVQETAARRDPERGRNQEIRAPRPVIANPVRSVGAPRLSEPNGDQQITADRPRDFSTVGKSDELRSLLKLLSSEGRTKDS
jgi:hypothetical protein